MSGVAVITGTTHGLGRVTSRELARAGRTVVMLCRDLRAAHALRAELVADNAAAAVQVFHCELASFASVRECAAAVRRQYPRIDLLINNAGTVSMRHRMSADGFELTFATNHLGPFLLTALLTPALEPGARIINVASRAHFRGRLDFDTISNPRVRYDARAAYSQSKLANVAHALALARRLAGRRICVNCLHPGVVATHLLPRWLRLVKPLFSPVIDAERGARPILRLALAADLAGVSGHYFDEHGEAQPAAPLAADVVLQETLWKMSAAWTGVLP